MTLDKWHLIRHTLSNKAVKATWYLVKRTSEGPRGKSEGSWDGRKRALESLVVVTQST
jgi:hypothetical protein